MKTRNITSHTDRAHATVKSSRRKDVNDWGDRAIRELLRDIALSLAAIADALEEDAA